MVAPHFQTFGTVVVGIATSMTLYFFGGNRVAQTLDIEEVGQPISNQQFGRNSVPETMYPRPIEVGLLRTIEQVFEKDCMVLISALWLPRHEEHYERFTKLVDEFWYRGFSAKVGFLSADVAIGN